jgi:hypothetical protein
MIAAHPGAVYVGPFARIWHGLSTTDPDCYRMVNIIQQIFGLGMAKSSDYKMVIFLMA